jgi:hypothetical protein
MPFEVYASPDVVATVDNGNNLLLVSLLPAIRVGQTTFFCKSANSWANFLGVPVHKLQIRKFM